MLTLDITPFRSGVHEATLTPSPADVELEPEEFRDIRVDMHLQCQRDRILATMTMAAQAHLTCDRTLRTFWGDVEGTYVVLFGPEHLVGEENDAYDEVRPMHPTDTEVEITDIVHDTLKLAIPQRVVAPGAEDEDIPMQFGVPEDEETGATQTEEDDIDPRWRKLKELKNGDA
ncbi:MAG: DUF177 domain-containing protein [Longimonas sp.]|uniref:YceD family protein n=1 Tax=Longimonas sp. TaxID=2039626 RepID=UPI0039753DB5